MRIYSRASQGRAKMERNSPNSIVITVDVDAPPETLEYLATIAKKTTYETDRTESIGELSRKSFGIQKGATEALLQLNPQLLNDSKTSHQLIGSVTIPAHTTIVLPELTPRWEKYAWVRIPPGWTISELADRLGNPTGPRSLQHFKAMNKGLRSLDEVPAYTTVRLPNRRSVQIIPLDTGLDPERTAREASLKPGVRFAAPNYEGVLEHPVQIDPDALASSGAHYDIKNLSDDWFVAKLGANDLLERDVTLKDKVTIAILDSGLDLSHPSFKDNLWKNPSEGSYPHNNVRNDTHGYDFSSFVSTPDDTLKDSHGTHVAGIASARYLGTRISVLNSARLDSTLKLMILRVADNEEHVTLGAVTLATDYAGFNGARVISASWTMRDYPSLADIISKNPRSLFVVAAGNGTGGGTKLEKGADIDVDKVFPASYRLPNIIVVGASDPDDGKAYFSNWGLKTVHLLAPGVNIKSTIAHINNEYTYGYNSGTSQAAPFVTLAAALILTSDNNMPVDSVKKRMLYTADIDPEVLKYTLHGRLNLLKAVAINEDLIELKNRTFHRGSIANSSLHFALEGADCNKATKFSVSQDKVFRVVVGFSESLDKLFLGTNVKTGRLCDLTLTIKSGSVKLDVPTSTIRDAIWHGVPQFDLPD